MTLKEMLERKLSEGDSDIEINIDLLKWIILKQDEALEEIQSFSGETAIVLIADYGRRTTREVLK